MANELRITAGVTYTNGRLTYDKINTQFPISQNVQGMHSTVWSVGTSEEDLAVGDIVTNGWLWMLNLDGTNFVKFGPKSAGAMVEVGRLKPTEPPALFRLAPGVTIRAIADTAACKVLVVLWND